MTITSAKAGRSKRFGGGANGRWEQTTGDLRSGSDYGQAEGMEDDSEGAPEKSAGSEAVQ